MNERARYIESVESEVRDYYDGLAPNYSRWVKRYKYYYRRKSRVLRHLFPIPGRVLEIGCGLGQNLAGMNPEYGLGIDCSGRIIEEAQKRFPKSDYPNLEFRCMSAMDVGKINEKFDTIILVNTITEIPELIDLFREIQQLCTPSTRVMQLTYNYVLAPLVKLAGMLGIAPRHPTQNWLTRTDLENIVKLAGFETVREGYDLIVPFGVPLFADLINRFVPLIPGLKYLAMFYFTVMRPSVPRGKVNDFSVSVCVPCKNEEGNIAGLVERIPEMGCGTEIIFVDDQSTDATAQEVNMQIAKHHEKSFTLVKGPGKGKGAACRAGFARAQNDILMILDADMTVMPEDLPQFFEALVAGKGEFINGSRLVYPLENDAMKYANIIGNKLFGLAFSFLLSQRLKDTLCGTKVIWRKDYEKILESRAHFSEVDMWGDYDWIFGAARHNLQIAELPVHYRMRVEGETKMTKRFRNAWVMLKMCNVAFWKVKLL